MKIVIQRVSRAAVSVQGKTVAAIGRGALVLIGVARGDTLHDAMFLARKTAQMRIFDDEQGRMNLAIDAVPQGAFLVVSQFTLYGDAAKGNRPSYIEAAAPGDAEHLYLEYVGALRTLGFEVQTGVFRENMQVELVNDGPVTILLESRGRTGC